MPLELTVWRLDQGLTRLSPQGMDLEERLEDLLAKDISIASADWMVIARQVPTPWGKRVDLLVLDRDGHLVVLELKRNKTERLVVAQVLDYGSWVRTLTDTELRALFNEYRRDWFPNEPAPSLDIAFCEHFGVREMPDELNESHQLCIVGATFDPATERIVKYLFDQYGVAINAVFFNVFKDGDREYLTRAWLIDAAKEAEVAVEGEDGGGRPAVPHPKTEWNGEYYANFGHNEDRSWEDARRYGFIAAGGGERYSAPLEKLQPGNRVWVNVPGRGFVGVGTVTGPRVPVTEFQVQTAKGRIPILNAELQAKRMDHDLEDSDKCEYLVPVDWLKAVPLAQAIKERGFFGNQTTVVRPRDAKWTFTIDRLTEGFGLKSLTRGSAPKDGADQMGDSHA